MSRDVSRARRDAIPCAYNILCSFMTSDPLKDCKVYTSTHIKSTDKGKINCPAIESKLSIIIVAVPWTKSVKKVEKTKLKKVEKSAACL